MKSLNRSIQIKVGIGALCLILIGSFWLVPHSFRGATKARVDLMLGKPVMKVHGLPAACSPVFWDILEKRYGIKSEVVAGCVSTENNFQYWEGYNNAITAYYNKKYGRDIFEECWAQAQEEWSKLQRELDQAT